MSAGFHFDDNRKTFTAQFSVAGPRGPQGEQGIQGPKGEPGYTPQKGVDYFDGKDGIPGTPGADGITPHVGSNGNWFIGDNDTGIPATGPAGADGAAGKSAYQYAQDGGYTGTEEEFIQKMAQETSGSGIHIGAEAPIDSKVDVWIDTDEEAPTVNPGGGTVVAQSDWNAAEGEPGHVLNRTHYENGTETKTLLDTSVTVASNQFQNVGYVPLTEGNVYTVTWDGVEYECVAFISNALGFPAPSIGNPYFSGGANNGMPFGFVTAIQYGQYGGAAMTNGSHTIKISEEVKAYKKLDECYLPYSARSYVIKLLKSDTQILEGEIEISRIRYDEFADILWNGGTVLVDVTDVYNGVVTVRIPARGFSYAEGKMNVAFSMNDTDIFSITFTNGTWTPPTE